MEQLQPILEQVRSFLVQHAPSEMLTKALPFALICLVGGTIFSVLGAKLARFAMTCVFILVGGAAGVFVAHHTGIPQPLCGLAGALMMGVIGYQTFRLWVGVMVALVLMAVTMGAFGYKQIVPRYTEFRQMSAQTATGDSTFAIPSPGEQQAYRDRTPGEWFDEFRTFVAERDSELEPRTKAISLAALVTGLCLGVLALRTALILSTSLIGTVLVSTALATLLSGTIEGSLQSLDHHPTVVGVALGAFFFTSVIVQTLLTRKAPTEESANPKAS